MLSKSHDTILNILTEFHNSYCNRHIYTDHYLNLVIQYSTNSAMDDKYRSVYMYQQCYSVLINIKVVIPAESIPVKFYLLI